MPDSIERCLEAVLTAPFYLGQILIQKITTGLFVLLHRDDESVDQLKSFRSAEDAIEIAKHDDAGNYRPLKTAPNLRHGWRLELATLEELRRALDYFYPGRLAVFAARKKRKLQPSSFRETLDRHRTVRLLQSLPRPGDLRPRICRVELRDKRPVQGGEPLAPRTGREQHFDEISGAVSPDIGEIQDER